MVASEPGKRWATRKLVSEVIAYPFSIGCNRITAYVKKGNKLSQKAVKQLGFKQEGKIRRAYKDGTDAIIYGMLPAEFRFWRKVRDVRKAA